MLIINADDWGRSRAETDAALECYRLGRITSASAMVFMEDSPRAAELAKESKLDVGLHLNFSQQFTGNLPCGKLQRYHQKIAAFLKRNKYAQLLYNPFLRTEFSYSYKAQAEEFERLFAKPPSHIDGHHHMHLCANVVFSSLIPAGTRMRRNFSFWPGEKSFLNRTYRGFIDRGLERKYQLTDYFFDLTQCMTEKKLARVAALARSNNVELMTHPTVPSEKSYLASEEFAATFRNVEKGVYSQVGRVSNQAEPDFLVKEPRVAD